MNIVMRMTLSSLRLISPPSGPTSWPKEVAALRWKRFLSLNSPEAQLTTYQLAWRRASAG